MTSPAKTSPLIPAPQVTRTATNQPSDPVSAAGIEPYRLRCQHLQEPAGLNDPLPFFAWSCRALGGHGASGGTATAYQIVAGRHRADVERGLGDLWDSGKCAGNPDSVPWGGQALCSDDSIWWSVRLWDGEGQLSRLADAALFRTGLKSCDWKAAWIARYFVLPAGRDVPQDNLYDNIYHKSKLISRVFTSLPMLSGSFKSSSIFWVATL